MIPEDKIRNCLSKMILRDSYWGYLFSNVTRKEFGLPNPFGVSIDDNGNLILFYNPIMVDLMDDSAIKKVLEHEGFHLINKHIIRLIKLLGDFGKEREEIVKNVWGIAADMAANYLSQAPDFIKIGSYEFKLIHAKNYKLDSGLSAEFYFNKLLNECEKQKASQGKTINSIAQVSEISNIDDHSQWSTGRENEEFLVKRAEKQINDLIYESLKSMRDRGHLPGNLNDLINKALEPPKVPYYQIVRKLVKSSRLSKVQKAYTKINKKRLYTFFLDGFHMLPFPSTRKDMSFKIGILIDTSGSMDEDKIREGLSGVKNIIEKDRDCETIVIECDAIIQKEYEVKRVSDIQFNIKGRGGTILQPGLERLKELKVDVALIFTDAYCDNINILPRYILPKRMIWVVPERSTISNIDKSGYIVRVNM